MKSLVFALMLVTTQVHAGEISFENVSGVKIKNAFVHYTTSIGEVLCYTLEENDGIKLPKPAKYDLKLVPTTEASVSYPDKLDKKCKPKAYISNIWFTVNDKEYLGHFNNDKDASNYVKIVCEKDGYCRMALSDGSLEKSYNVKINLKESTVVEVVIK